MHFQFKEGRESHRRNRCVSTEARSPPNVSPCRACVSNERTRRVRRCRQQSSRIPVPRFDATTVVIQVVYSVKVSTTMETPRRVETSFCTSLAVTDNDVEANVTDVNKFPDTNGRHRYIDDRWDL